VCFLRSFINVPNRVKFSEIANHSYQCIATCRESLHRLVLEIPPQTGFCGCTARCWGPHRWHRLADGLFRHRRTAGCAGKGRSRLESRILTTSHKLTAGAVLAVSPSGLSATLTLGLLQACP